MDLRDEQQATTQLIVLDDRMQYLGDRLHELDEEKKAIKEELKLVSKYYELLSMRIDGPESEVN